MHYTTGPLRDVHGVIQRREEGGRRQRRAAEVFQTIETENNLVADMRKWIEETRETFCVSDTAGLSGSELYFQREQDIHDAIMNQFPDIDESLLDIFVEETYQALFEQI